MRDLTQDSLQIGKAGAVIFIALFIDKILGIFKEILVAYKFGVSHTLDVFNVAMALPGLIIVFLTSSLISAFVPIYVGWISKHPVEKADEKSLSILYSNVVILSLFSLAGYFLVPYLFPLLGYGFSPEQAELGIHIQRLLILLFVLEGVNITFLGILQARKKFFYYSTTPILLSVTLIAFLLAGDTLGIYALVYGFLCGTFIKIVYIFVYLKKKKFRFITTKIDTSVIKSYYLLALPMVGSDMIAMSNFLVDQVMATNLVQGSVSSLNYAHRISSLPIYIVVVSISQSILPYLSQYATVRDFDSFRNVIKNSIVLAGFISFPPTVLFLWFSQDIVSLLLERGAFDAEATIMTAGNLFYYTLGIFFHSYVLIHGAFFVALKNTKSLAVLATISFILNIIFNYIFMKYMGVQGIALSTSVTLLIIFLVSFLLLKKISGFNQTKQLFQNIFLMVSISFFIYCIGFFVLNHTFVSELKNYVYLPIGILIFILVYFSILWKLRTREIESCFYIFLQLGVVMLRKIKVIRS